MPTIELDTIAIRAGHPDYDDARTVYMGRAGTPEVVFKPRTVEEVAGAVRYAVDEGLELSVRSGGHSTQAWGTNDGGAVIHLSAINGVEVLGDGIVRVGGGALWGDVAAQLASHGLALTSGDTKSVGVGGIALGGGFGWLVRKYGLTVDTLVAADVVTAAGEIVRASADENADLFWALRGGGGNFGVVTHFEFAAQPVPTVHGGMIMYAPGDARGALQRWRDVMRAAPEELSTGFMLMPGFGDFPAGAAVFACFCGDDADAEAVLAPLLGIGDVTMNAVERKGYVDILDDAHPPAGVRPVVANTLVRTLDDGLLDDLAAFYAEGSAGRVVMIRSLGGAYSRVPADATAIAHRDAEAMVVGASFVPADGGPDDVANAVDAWAPIASHGAGSYGGFLGDEVADGLSLLYPPETLARLRRVKAVWDPENIFRRNFNVTARE